MSIYFFRAQYNKLDERITNALPKGNLGIDKSE
jgi:hypothetical protein